MIGGARRVLPGLAGLPAPADTVQLAAEAGQQQQDLAQDHRDGEYQGEHEAGRQVEAVGLLLKGPTPPEQQAMKCGNQEGNITQS